ncbi:beta-lactamase family protein [Candidatus Babeliales bacterium]|nr:beta-lactamase family protein [Candidatus Babeliales bacterium]MBP9843511.1 beta-lactamase family protein [Candidatus Babeliales bacterium]
MQKIITIISLNFIVFLAYHGDIYSKSHVHVKHSKIDACLKRWEEQKLFSGSVLVAQHGKIILSQGYGMANYELDIPNTPDTKFRLGSITKQFTAYAIMQLQKKGLLSVDDTLDTYIPDYPQGNVITIHQLLTHTSGIPNFTSLPEYEKLEILPATINEVIATFKDKPFNFEPGLKHRYSNSGYILLTDIIEKVSGQTYEQYLQDHIFTPLGMHNSGYDHYELLLKNRASGYSLYCQPKNAPDQAFDIVQNASYINMKVPSGAGALYSTVEDLLLWDRFLHAGDKAVNSLIKSTVKIDLENKELAAIEYGYGIVVDTDSPLLHKKTIGHNGGIDGFVTTMTHFVDEDIVIIALSNFDFTPIGKLSHNIDHVLFDQEYELPAKNRKIMFKKE